MWKKNITGLDRAGTFRSLNGAADENIFIGKAGKAGFFCFFKVWRDMPYDAVLDYDGVLYRVEVKGSSGNTFDLTRGSRSGAQINRQAASRKRLITREDCDFTVCVDSNNGDCYILPTDVIEIFGRHTLNRRIIECFKEQWQLFQHGPSRLTREEARDGLRCMTQTQVEDIAARLGIFTPLGPSMPLPRGMQFAEEKDRIILIIWESLCTP